VSRFASVYSAGICSASAAGTAACLLFQGAHSWRGTPRWFMPTRFLDHVLVCLRLAHPRGMTYSSRPYRWGGGLSSLTLASLGVAVLSRLVQRVVSGCQVPPRKPSGAPDPHPPTPPPGPNSTESLIDGILAEDTWQPRGRNCRNN